MKIVLLKCLASFFLLVISFSVFCQTDNTTPTPSETTPTEMNRSPFLDKLEFGGNIGIGLGTTTVINLSPIAGFKLSERWAAGFGVTYLYFRDAISDYSTSVYGGRLYSRYTILQNIFVYGEYEILNGEFDFLTPGNRINITSLMAGGGYQQSLGGKAKLFMMALWNFNESIYSPYRNPIFRGGVTFGI